jgi:hypothetical protein
MEKYFNPALLRNVAVFFFAIKFLNEEYVIIYNFFYDCDFLFCNKLQFF